MQVGYRLFDTASCYGSEGALGAALAEAFQSGVVKREEVFVTSKLWDDQHDDPVAAITKSLKYINLHLLNNLCFILESIFSCRYITNVIIAGICSWNT